MKKIALLGIANAGKTSILKCVFQEFESLMNLNPTNGVERNVVDFLKKPLFFWDFGGQQLYRDKYMARPEQYFLQLGHVFYVVDVQDQNMIDASVVYFGLIMKEIMTYSPDAQIILLFHKNDPTESERIKQINAKEEFLNGIKPILEEHNIPLIMYLTSIKNHLTIVRAFSQSLLNNDNVYENISAALKTYCFNYSLKFSIFFAQNGFEIGNYIPKTVNTDGFHETIVKFFSRVKKNKIDQALMFKVGTNTIIGSMFELKFGKSTLPFYLVFGFDKASMFMEMDEIEEVILKLKDGLQKVISNSDLTKYL